MHDLSVRCISVITALVVSWGCTKKNPVVCCLSPSDCSAVGIMETERPCDLGFACIDHQCTTPPDAPPAPPCATNEDCAAPKPYCSPQQVCVECLSSDQCPELEPVCDMTSSCRACLTDDECASSVCDASAGVCVTEDKVLYASPSGGDTTTCAKASPCSIARAFQLADSSRQTVKMLPGTYTASLTVNAKTVLVHGAGATLNAAAGANAFSLDNGGRLRLLGISLVNINSPSNGIGISCYPTAGPTPTVELDQVAIDAADTAVLGYPCSITITRSRLKTRTSTKQIVYALPTSSITIDRTLLDGGNGVQAEGTASVVRITNSVVKNQTGPDGAFIGSNLFGQGPGSVFVSSTTVINSLVKCGPGAPRCAGGTAAGSCLENTIVYNASTGAPADTVQAAGCSANYSLVFPQSSAISGGNNLYGMNPMFEDFAAADYHLGTSSPAIDTADPASTNLVDYDGTMRPQGTRSDIGAFERKPQ